MTKSRYFVKEADVTPYSPANHGDTVNRRLIYSPPYGESKEKGIAA